MTVEETIQALRSQVIDVEQQWALTQQARDKANAELAVATTTIADYKLGLDTLTAQLERTVKYADRADQRGDTYRCRALAELRLCKSLTRIWRREQQEVFVEQRRAAFIESDRRLIRIRADALEAQVAELRELLELAKTWRRAQFKSSGYYVPYRIEAEARDAFTSEIDRLLDEDDAALAAQPPDAGKALE